MNQTPVKNAITNFLLHLHPAWVNRDSIWFTRTFGLGGIAALLFVLLFTTGMLLRFAYVPTVESAYDSITDLQKNVLFGQLLRNFHYWSGMFLVIVSFLHVLRVFYSNSIYLERRKNWFYGIIIMFLVVSANFTGYLLPWDQLSFWAVTIMTNMLSYIPFIGDWLANIVRSGTEVNGSTLLRFYNYHTGLLPLIIAFLLTIHFWLVRKAKGVTHNNMQKKEMVPTNPELIYKELVVALAILLGLVIISMFADAPLQEKANPLVSPNPSRAPWYFMGFQELLLHIHPGFGIFVIPILVTGFLIYIPFMIKDEVNVGVWFNSPNGKLIAIQTIVFAVILTLAVILTSEYFIDLHRWLPGVPVIITTGSLLLLLYFIPAGAWLLYINSKYNTAKVEIVMALVTILITAYLTMMMVGSCLRGEGMTLFF